jgi:uncharacterized protein (DUF952 family)
VDVVGEWQTPNPRDCSRRYY